MDKGRWETLLKRHQFDNSVQHIEGITVSLAVGKGENYLSRVERIKANVILGTGNRATVYFIVKNIPSEKGRNKFVRDLGAFKSETQVYLHVLKEMENLMREMEDSRDKLWPELIWYHPYDMLIFNDLVWENFKVPSRLVGLDLDHALLTMVELARFHAMAKILLIRGLIGMDDFQVYFLAKKKEYYRRFVGVNIEKFGEVIEQKWEPEWKGIGMRLKKCAAKLEQQTFDLRTVDEKRFNVMNHGDLRTNNMMFKYCRSSKKPIAVKFVDYQLCHYNSIGWDLTYFLYSSIDTSIRQKNYHDIVKRYSDCLREALLMYGYPESGVPTLKDVLDDIERVAPFRIASTIFIRLFMISKNEEPLDMEAVMNCKVEDVPSYPESVFVEPEVKAAIGPDLKEFAKMNLI